MHLDSFLIASVTLALIAAVRVLLADSIERARHHATWTLVVALGILAIGFTAGVTPSVPSFAVSDHAQWLSARVVAIAAFSAGIIITALTPLLNLRRYDLAALCMVVAIAGAMAFVGNVSSLMCLAALGVVSILPSVLRRGNAEVAALITLSVGGVTLVGLLSTYSATLQPIFVGLWFCVVLAVPPFHSWYLKLLGAAPLPIFSAMVILQASIVQSARFNLPLHGSAGLTTLLAVGGLFSALLAIAQRDARRMVAFICSSQMAVAAFAEVSDIGAVNLGGTYLLLTLITATLGAVMLIGALEARRGMRLTVTRPNGSYESWHNLANGFLILGLISAGLPLTLGYASIELVMQGSFIKAPSATVMVLLSNTLNAIAIMRMYLYLFQGHAGQAQPSDLRPRELIVTFGILLLTFGVAFAVLPN